MRFQRAISVITMFTFLPLAVGCSTTKTAGVNAKPEVGRDGRVVDVYEQPVEIAAYTLADGQRYEWRGTVQAAGRDSLEFRREVRRVPASRGAGNAPPIRAETLDSGPQYESRYLARAEVVSIERRVISGVKTTFLVLGVLLVVLVLVAAATPNDYGDPIYIGPDPGPY